MSTYFQQWQSGTDVYLGIHGWGGGWNTFEPLAEFLPANAALYAPDLPGFGATPSLEPWTEAAMTAAILEVVDKVEGDITLVGNCSGAIFGLLAALERPARFKRLVLLEPFAFSPWYFRILTWPVLGRFFYTMAFQNPLGRLITNLSLSSRRTSDTDLTESFESLNHDAVFAHLLLLDRVGSFTRFAPLNCPIDLIIGARSFGAIRESATQWLSIWKQARVHVLDEAGHLPLQEAPRRVAEITFIP